jgi:2-dehydro-3-deoxyphosphogluconate aldolase/(4S)-4-hydroxy-2-oxoglutarate aldolase
LGHTVPLAKALVEGGLNILEITLRTPAALEAVRAISAKVRDAVVGAGTVINAQQFAAAAGAGPNPWSVPA